jgi:hypothetical protein
MGLQHAAVTDWQKDLINMNSEYKKLLLLMPLLL